MLTSRWIAACGEPSYDGKGLGHWLAELRDANPAARRAAVHALGCLHPPTKAVIPALIAALKDPDLPVRSNAAASVVRVDRGRIKEALPALIAGLKSQETDVRRDVAEALGEAGPAAGQASPDLIGACTIQIARSERKQPLLWPRLTPSGLVWRSRT